MCHEIGDGGSAFWRQFWFPANLFAQPYLHLTVRDVDLGDDAFKRYVIRHALVPHDGFGHDVAFVGGVDWNPRSWSYAMMQAKMITPGFLAVIMGVGHSCITMKPFGALFV